MPDPSGKPKQSHTPGGKSTSKGGQPGGAKISAKGGAPIVRGGPGDPGGAPKDRGGSPKGQPSAKASQTPKAPQAPKAPQTPKAPQSLKAPVTPKASQASKRPAPPSPTLIKASEAKISDLPKPPDRSAGAMAAAFSEAHELLDGIVGKQNQRVTELQLNANHGLAESLSRFGESCRFVRAVLERNDELAREAERLGVEGEQLALKQGDMVADVKRLADHNQDLAGRVNQMREERHKLQVEAQTLEDAYRNALEGLSQARTEAALLASRREKAEAEVEELTRENARLDKQVHRLEGVREEFLERVRLSQQTVSHLTKDA